MKLLFSILLSSGLFLIALDYFKVPPLKTSRVLMAAANMKNRHQTKRLDVIKSDISIWLSKFIRINPYKKNALEEKIRTAQVPFETAEQFIANNLILPFFVLIVAILIFSLIPIMGIALGIIAVLLYFRETENLNKLIAQKREAIEKDLNRFTSYISKTIKHNKDVITILENFIKYAGDGLADELKITVADMKSGNQETALTRLEARVNSTALSDITRGLISTIQGNSTHAYWETLSIKFSEFERQRLKRQAVKIPDKVSRCTMVLVIEFIMMMVLMFGMQLKDSMVIFS